MGCNGFRDSVFSASKPQLTLSQTRSSATHLRRSSCLGLQCKVVDRSIQNQRSTQRPIGPGGFASGARVNVCGWGLGEDSYDDDDDDDGCDHYDLQTLPRLLLLLVLVLMMFMLIVSRGCRRLRRCMWCWRNRGTRKRNRPEIQVSLCPSAAIV